MASSAEVMLDEMRHAFDATYESAKKYANKTFTVFGAEIAILLFYLAADEMGMIKDLFSDLGSGWWLLAVFALGAFVAAAILFVISMAFDVGWRFPPDPAKLVDDDYYSKLDPEEVRMKLIREYDRDIKFCIGRIHKIKLLTNLGLYFLLAGVAALLLIKFFGNINIREDF